MQAKIHQLKSWQGVVFPVAARVVGENGSPYVKNDISEINYTVYGPDGEETQYGEGTFNRNTCLFDELQLDSRWTQDGLGFNFAGNIPGEAFPDPGHYRIEIIFEIVGGNKCPIVISAEILKVNTLS